MAFPQEKTCADQVVLVILFLFCTTMSWLKQFSHIVFERVCHVLTLWAWKFYHLLVTFLPVKANRPRSLQIVLKRLNYIVNLDYSRDACRKHASMWRAWKYTSIQLCTGTQVWRLSDIQHTFTRISAGPRGLLVIGSKIKSRPAFSAPRATAGIRIAGPVKVVGLVSSSSSVHGNSEILLVLKWSG